MYVVKDVIGWISGSSSGDAAKNDNEDKRNYKVSAEKLKQIGFEPSKTIEDAINEIKEMIDNGQLSNYDDAKYSNYKLLFGSKEMQEKVFIQGMPGSLDVP